MNLHRAQNEMTQLDNDCHPLSIDVCATDDRLIELCETKSSLFLLPCLTCKRD